MRMHRGSSKGARRSRPAPETLPLSVSGSSLAVTVEVARAGSSVVHHLDVAPGSLVREALHRIGLHPEGSAVLLAGTSIPLDTPLTEPVRLLVVPTFSGG
jgi:sulfur carrier protein ThiS